MERINKKRIEWIDICKGLGIFLVVIGHTGIAKVSQTAYDWIYSFHMPFFYMISGLVFNETKYDTFGKYIKRRLKTLIIPFFILNTILFCIAKILNLDNIQPPMHEIFTGVLAMYFLRVLFISEIYYFFLNKFFKICYLKLIAVVILISLSSYINRSYHTGYLWFIMPGIHLLYYSLGNILKNEVKTYAAKIKINSLIVLIILSLVFSLCIISININFILMDIVLAISGITTLLSIGLIISKIPYGMIKDSITYIGMNTLVIVAFHQIIYNGLTIITKRIELSTIMDSGIRMISVWVILVILCKLLNRFLPIAIGK